MTVHAHSEAISTVPCGGLYANLMFWWLLLALQNLSVQHMDSCDLWLVVCVCVFIKERNGWERELLSSFPLGNMYYRLLTFTNVGLFPF